MALSKKSAELAEKIAILPSTPGVYTYYDAGGTVIYVGKAKNLKRRVSSYFNRTHDSLRTNLLVRAIADMSYIVVPTEQDALNLENSMIKEHQPRYNVLLKDDKSYPWIVVTNEHYPRVFMTRQHIRPVHQHLCGPRRTRADRKTVSLTHLPPCNHARIHIKRKRTPLPPVSHKKMPGLLHRRNRRRDIPRLYRPHTTDSPR